MGNTIRFIGVWCVVLVCGCAQVKPIAGGDKDQTPPKVLQYMPQNEQVNFGSKSFTLTFDEYVTLNNIQQELVVSPPLLTMPQIIVRKKTVVVSWKEDLLPNTTYNFQFGDGIVDINEANKALDINYVFSTGPQLDSGSSKILVIENFTGEISKQSKVLLFENDSDFFSTRPRPAYVSKTDNKGIAHFKFIRPGEYAIYALDDINGNYRADDGEQVGFQPTPLIIAGADSLTHSLRLCHAIPEVRRIERYLTDSTGVLHFYWPPIWGSMQTLPMQNQTLQTWVDPKNDTIWTYLQGEPTNQYERLQVTNQNEIADTLEIPFFKQTSDRWSLIVKDKKLISGDWPTFISTSPIDIQSPIQRLWGKDSILFEARWMNTDAPHIIRLEGAFQQGQNYKGLALPGVFKNKSGIVNDSLVLDFMYISDNEIGKLQLDLSLLKSDEPYVIQLINKKNEVANVLPISKPGIYTLNKIIPGEYQVRMLADTNRNGMADLTQLKSKMEAEHWYILSKSVLIRANWEVQLKPDIILD